MAQAGGRWWRRHVTDINRWKLAVISWEETDGGKRYFDASGVEQADRAKPVEGTPVESAVGLLSTEGDDPSVEAELTLFPSRGRSPYDVDEAA